MQCCLALALFLNAPRGLDMSAISPAAVAIPVPKKSARLHNSLFVQVIAALALGIVLVFVFGPARA